MPLGGEDDWVDGRSGNLCQVFCSFSGRGLIAYRQYLSFVPKTVDYMVHARASLPLLSTSLSYRPYLRRISRTNPQSNLTKFPIEGADKPCSFSALLPASFVYQQNYSVICRGFLLGVGLLHCYLSIFPTLSPAGAA